MLLQVLYESIMDYGDFSSLTPFTSIGALCGILCVIGILCYYGWCWIDDQDLPRLGYGSGEGPIAFLICMPSVVALICGTLSAIALFLWYGLGWIFQFAVWMCTAHLMTTLCVLGFVVLMFVARYGRRTHKLLRKHMDDKDAHK